MFVPSGKALSLLIRCLIALFVASCSRRTLALEPISSEQLQRALSERLARLDRFFIEFEWWEYHPPIESDPFDRQALEKDASAFLRPVKMTILRPWFRIERYQTSPAPRAIEGSWVNGICTSKAPGQDDVKWWSAVRDENPYRLVGPLPLLTPLELSQTFDLRAGLLDLAKQDKFSAEVGGNGHWQLLCKDAAPEPHNWSVSAELDPDRDFLPVNMKAWLTSRDGEIHWEMRIVAAAPLGQSWIPEEALIVLRNTGAPVLQWQVYRFKTVNTRILPTLSAQELQISLPTTNVRIIDEVAGYARHVDGSGVATFEKKWTREERAATLQAAAEENETRRASKQLLVGRQRTYLLAISTGVCAALLVFGAIMWRRRLAAGSLG